MGCATKMSKFLRHMNAWSWIRMCHPFCYSIVYVHLFTKKFPLSISCWMQHALGSYNLAKLSLLHQSSDRYSCLCRIRGDQQHFVRRDELKVCATLHIFVFVVICEVFYLQELFWFHVTLNIIPAGSQAAWQIFTPLLHDIDDGKMKAVPYQPGSRGPKEADELSARVGYVQTHGYVWVSPTLA